MNSAAMMTETVDGMRGTTSTEEMLAALQVEQDAYLEMGDVAAANEVAREINITRAYGPNSFMLKKSWLARKRAV